MQSIVLRDLAGQPTKRFVVETGTLTLNPAPRRVAHHIVVVDRSGSMWHDMASVRSVVEKVAVLEEYRDSELLLSVISYSSRGDCTTHVSRVPLHEVMKPGSIYVEQIRAMQPTGLTCMSQAFEAGLSLVRPGEPTVLTFHSDGYANDSSPTEEKRKIEQLLDTAKKQELDLAIDTVAYSDCSDFRLLLSISDKMGGRCVVARDAKVVYQALLETQKRLAEGTASPITVDLAGHDYVLLVSRSASKICLSEKGKDLVVRGLKPGDDATIYKLREDASAQGLVDAEPQAYYALSAALLARGQIRAAKEVLCSTRDHVFQMHWRALSRADIEAFYADVVASLGDPVNRPTTKTYGVLASGPALVDLFSAMAEHARDIDIDLDALAEGYRLRSVRRLSGARDESGALIQPPVKFEAVKEADGWTKVSGIQLSNANATLNVRLVRPGRLLLQSDTPPSVDVVMRGEEVVSVAGIDLQGKLSVYRNYTVVSDGSVHCKKLRARVRSKAAWRALEQLGVCSGSFDHKDNVLEISLKDSPVVDFRKGVAVSGLSGAVETMLQAKMVLSVLRALGGGTSARFSSDQVEALDSVCVTPGLNVSTPTTTPYTNKDEALRDGIIDVEIGCKVELGLHDVLPSQLPSANDFLGRHFSVLRADADAGWTEMKDMKFADLISPSIGIAKKPLSSRAKPAATDGLFLPLFEDLFGSENGTFSSFCAKVGLDDAVRRSLLRFLPWLLTNTNTRTDRAFNLDDKAEIVEQVRKKVEEAYEGLLADKVRPLVFWVGATGTLPEEIDCPPLSAEQAKARGTGLKVGKKLDDATFYFLPDNVLLAAIPEERLYSTGKVTSFDEVDEGQE